MPWLVFLIALTAWTGTAPAQCAGDCNADGEVAVNELITGVGIALGGSAVALCPSFDVDRDGSVAIAELVTAVNNALIGCHTAPPSSTPSPPQTETPTPTATPTVTATPAVGPQILLLGLANADDSFQPPSGTDPNGIPIYQRPFGFGFSLLVEARRGSSGVPVGNHGIVEGGTPDLQVQVTRALGNGSPAVCDAAAPTFGGVPGVDPPRIENPDTIADALNDLGCRFIDGEGLPNGRSCAFGCVRFESGEFGCQSGPATELQFCAPVPMSMAFQGGDTLVTARVRDLAGNLGAPRQIIIRVVP